MSNLEATLVSFAVAIIIFAVIGTIAFIAVQRQERRRGPFALDRRQIKRRVRELEREGHRYPNLKAYSEAADGQKGDTP